MSQDPHYQQQYQQPPYGYQQQPGPGWQGSYPEPQKSKVAAGILGILLGGLGIHNFYLGNTTRGLIQLLITVLSFGFLAVVSSVWGLVEGVLILTSTPETQWGRDAKGIPLG